MPLLCPFSITGARHSRDFAAENRCAGHESALGLTLPMRLLVTNDDGVQSPFLDVLVRALRARDHEVFVAAPAHEQSWIGAAKSRHRAVKVAPVDRGWSCPTWTLDGTPSDCVNIALAYLLPRSNGDDHPVDAVVSGINLGMNASLSFIPASGTIGGAWEGAVHGLPAVALSQDLSAEDFSGIKHAGAALTGALKATVETSAAIAAARVAAWVEDTPRGGFIVHNLNFPFPCRPEAPLRRTTPCKVIVPTLFGPAADDGTHRFVFRLGRDVSPPGEVTDRLALAAGEISHTVLDYRSLGHPVPTHLNAT